ncbi:DUF397 domain-containing protein [Streptomyces sp. P1-3]|uniref:DUF397 domain-containing protein n=1 Tax=Streptomyces sp. P1-3 TaxID=3421658 RepID=UPI003D366020
MLITQSLSAAVWRKSSYSDGNEAACIEVAEGFPGAAQWRKSSFSSQAGAECIEVAHNCPGIVPVRDSKNPHGPALLFPADAWAAFVAGVKAGDFAGSGGGA